jgi:hypothetical protein
MALKELDNSRVSPQCILSELKNDAARECALAEVANCLQRVCRKCNPETFSIPPGADAEILDLLDEIHNVRAKAEMLALALIGARGEKQLPEGSAALVYQAGELSRDLEKFEKYLTSLKMPSQGNP